MKISPHTKNLQCRDEEQTIAYASAFAALLNPGDLILISGEMGSGKTTFARGLGNTLNCISKIQSPTFTRLNVHQGKWTFYHLDLYNVDSLEEVEDLGIYEIMNSPDGICLIEWWEKFEPLFQVPCFHVRITNHKDYREISWEKK